MNMSNIVAITVTLNKTNIVAISIYMKNATTHQNEHTEHLGYNNQDEHKHDEYCGYNNQDEHAEHF